MSGPSELVHLAANQDCDYLLKILIVGEAGVGKSSVLLQFTDHNFTDRDFPTTVGLDLKFACVSHESKTIQLQIWDTAGQERFRTITSSFCRGTHGVLLTFDITDRASFACLDKTRSERLQPRTSRVSSQP
eukprot:TRINITY_DN5251_c0_g1_i1.p1 TRINITY_DN5251_c0_g1~~TRINITY_DN5251_c0_g1_i1.p1  ORF type:complete len:131 (+),score=20.45 TRINITY_DN5251_c0_g1_i1:122-514(+)